jgi:hypothetical protein
MFAQEGGPDRSLLLQGKLACNAARSLSQLSHLSDAEFRVYSQWGEDGILEWLLQRLPISSPAFVEFGVENYSEANTRFLLVNRNWKGLIMDGSAEHMQAVRSKDIYWRHDLTALCAFIDRQNINALIAKSGFSGRIGVLSVDIDGNDYWVWQAIDVVDADIVICEYNAVFGDLYPITIPYRPDFHRTTAHSSNLYWGASIAALRFLARQKGYELAGSNKAGTNAFFVREDLFPRVTAAVACMDALPSLLRESRDPNGHLSFVSGLDRSNRIGAMPVVRVDTGDNVPLETLGPLYSRNWLSAMCSE